MAERSKRTGFAQARKAAAGKSGSAAAAAREAAIVDILRVISASPGDLQPVFDTILEHTLRLCSGHVAALWQYDGEKLRYAAARNSPAEVVAYMRQHPLELGDWNPTPQAALERRVMNVEDVFANPQYRPLIPPGTSGKRPNAGTVLAVPLVRGEELFGVITIWRYVKRLFSEDEVELVKTFTAQAVIAIQNVRLFHETRQALEQQTATSEILRVISSSPTSVQPVFEAILDNATRLCEAQLGALFVTDGEIWNMVSHRGASLETQAAYRNFRVGPNTGLGCMLDTLAPVHIEDLVADAATAHADPLRIATIERLGARTFLAVPLLKEGRVIGALVIYRKEVRPFADPQIRLVRTFADQAVIAIENVRLFNETREALEQQTATSEILGVISRSPTDITPVFEAILKSATELCEAHLGVLSLREGDGFRTVAQRGANPEFAKYVFERGIFKPVGAFARMVAEGKAVQVEDLREGDAYRAGKLNAIQFVEVAGARTFLAVPLLKDRQVIGGISIYRPEVRPFTAKQVALVSTFASQAVIAIENVRLFNETKEALERQTATADVLKVISASPTDVQPVFDAVAERAAQLCSAEHASLLIAEGDTLRVKARVGRDLPFKDLPIRRTLIHGRAFLEGRTVHVEDVLPLLDTEYPDARENQRRSGFRTFLSVPMRREDRTIGTIGIWRDEVKPFTMAQIELLETFAAQAVIAIENVRLFNETKEALEQQTAISEVLRVISSSPADVQPVLEAVAERAAKICDAVDAQIFLREGDDMQHVARFGPMPIGVQIGDARPVSRGWVAGRAVLEGRAIHIEDLLAVPREEYPVSHELRDRAGHRTLLSVPLMRERKALGAISLRRMEVRPFTDKQIALLQTFADQAAIAIENVRLFNETKEALERQKATAEVLGAISSSIADTRPVFDKILESCQRLFEGKLIGVNLVGADGLMHLAAYQGPGREGLEKSYPLRVTPDSGSGLCILERRVMHFPEGENTPGMPETTRRNCRATGIKSVLFAPMIWEGEAQGVIFVGRQFSGPFAEQEIALLKTFADQAVIAMQNAKLFREIREKSAQLEVANKHKSEFLANMSHELRTPLNAIIGFSEALQDRLFGEVNEKQAEYLKDIHDSGRHLLSLINDILDLSKIEAGRMELEVSTFHLPSALSNAITLIRERAQRHGISLGLEIDEGLGQFFGDERKFKQIMLNLLSNAVKFTPDGGRIDVSARQSNSTVEVAVRDTGIGIAPEDQAAVFEEFRQVGRDNLRKAEGTGLGLALTKRFVELHGGAIRLESTPGKGSIFTVSLPLRQ